MIAPRSVFVGRTRSIGELERLLADAASGHGGLRLITGEAGIGKTTLVEHVASRHAAFATIWGACWEGDGAPPLWPWIQVMRGVARTAPTPDVAGRLVPRLGHADPRVGDRFELFDAVAGCLRDAAAATPLLIVLDDLHWADRASVMLLRFMVPEVRAARIALVGTYRDLEVPPAHELHKLTRSGVLELGGLERADVEALVRAVSPDDIDADRLHRTTGGNPFFVHEMLRGDPATIPTSVGDVIRRRRDRVSGEARAALEVAAVIGRQLPRELAAQLASAPAIAELVAARLLDEDPASPSQLRFPHAVVREVIYGDLPAPERAHLHLRVGEALEPTASPAELAFHFTQASALAKAVEHGERAGHAALAVAAYEEAATHFARALEQTAPGVHRNELRLQLGRARHAAGQLAEAHDAFEQVAREAVEPEQLARAALSFGVEFTAGVVDPREVRLLELAAAALPAEHPLSARVLARLGKALLFTPDHDRRTTLTETAVAMARRLGEPATLAATLYDRHVALWGGPEVGERLAIAREVVELAERCGDSALALQGRALMMGNLLELGEIPALQTAVDTYDELARRLRRPMYLWHVPLLRSALASLAARFEAAEELAAIGLEMGLRTEHPSVAVFHAAAIGALRFSQGRFAELEPMLGRSAEQWPSLVVFRASHVHALAAGGQRDAAAQALDILVADGLRAVPRDFTWVASLAQLAMAAWLLDDRRSASVVYELLAPYRACCVRLTRIGIGALGAAAHYLGLLAVTLGRWDEARAQLEAALETNLRIGAPAFVANSRAALAAVLEHAGERGAAEDQARRARSAAEALGFGLVATRTATPSPREVLASLRREGELWSLGFGGASARIRDTVGLRHVARLIDARGSELHVLDLSGHDGDGDDGAAILDPRAKAAIRERLATLDLEVAEAEARADPTRAMWAREEIARLAEELAHAVGLGGRDRRIGSDAERARVRVAKAIKAALRRIREALPTLAEHLEVSVRTGIYCSYVPDPTVRIRWEVTM